MTKTEYLSRRQAGKRIESARELVHALNEVGARIAANTRLWFFVNRLIRWTMDLADEEDRLLDRTT